MGWALALGKLPCTPTDEFVWGPFCWFFQRSGLMDTLVLLLQRGRKGKGGNNAEKEQLREVMNASTEHIGGADSFCVNCATEMAVESIWIGTWSNRRFMLHAHVRATANLRLGFWEQDLYCQILFTWDSGFFLCLRVLWQLWKQEDSSKLQT